MAVTITRTADPAGAAGTANVVTYSSVSIGTASSDRIIVLVVASELTSASPDSATIDFGSGDTAMLAGAQGNLSAIFTRTFHLPVPTGTTATFKVTFGANPSAIQNHVAVYSITGAGNVYNCGAASDTDADPIAVTLSAADILANGAMLVVCADASDTTTRTYSGATKDLDEASGTGGFRFSTGTMNAGQAFTISGNNQEDAALSFIIFNATATTFGDFVGGVESTAAAITNPLVAIRPTYISVGDLVIVTVTEVSGLTSTTCSDNLGNSYTALTSGTNSTANLKSWYSVATTGGACTPSVTTTASAHNSQITVTVYKGPFAASPLDVNPAVASDSSSPYAATATGTLAQADELIIGYFGEASTNSYLNALPSGAVIIYGGGNAQAVQAASHLVAISAVVVASTSTVTASVEGVNTTNATVCGVATFKKGAPPVPLPDGKQFLDLSPIGPEYHVQFRSWLGAIPPYPPVVYALRTPLFALPREPEYHVQLRTWIGGKTIEVVAPLPFNEYDWPNPRGYIQPIGIRTITASYNPNLISQDKLPVGKISAELTVKPYEFHSQLRQWSWRYNLNLIGKDAFPPGKDIFDLTPRPYEYHIQLRTWYGAIPPPPPPLPFNEYDWPINFGPIQPLREWSWTYNLNLIGEDKLPTGEVVTDLPPKAPQQPISIFTASYNKNLIGQDQLPVGVDITNLPPQPPLSAIQLRTWITFVNLALSTPPQPKPFAQYDWPLNTGPKQPTLIWTASYNQNLIGQDKLPFSQQYWPLTPAAVREINLSTWISQVKLLLLVPFRQIDWPVPIGPKQPALSYTFSYNLNLIGQDQLPTGEVVTDLPPQPPLSAIQLRTWINTVNLALVTTPAKLPFNQYDWPINTGPRQPTQVFTASYNRNLVGKDRLPFRQQDWPLPTQPSRPLSLTAWFDRAKSYLQTPHHQLDWPLPRAHQQPIQTFVASYNRNLIGKDRLPFRQQDWPLTPDNRRLSDWIVRTNPNLLPPPPPVLRPFNQYDWPLPSPPIAKFRQRYSITYQGNNLLPMFVSPIPPPPPPTPPTDEPYRFTPGLEWQIYDRIREPGPVGWR